jgi:hypothetical protein
LLWSYIMVSFSLWEREVAAAMDGVAATAAERRG